MIDPRYSVTGSGHALSRKQEELIALADSVGPAFAKRAEKYGREASFPFENYADLKKAGLLGLCVPEKFGGMDNPKWGEAVCAFIVRMALPGRAAV